MDRARKRFLLVLFSSSSFLLLVAVISIATTASRHKSNSSPTASHAIVRQSCSSTLYPELCFTTLTSVPSHLHSKSTHKDVILSSINLTRTAVERQYFKFKKIYGNQTKLTEREVCAIHDCLEMIDETIEELRKVEDDLNAYPGGGKSLARHADDMETLLSATMTNQGTCLDGFAHNSVCRKLRTTLEDGVKHVSKMCSNSLAMCKNMAGADINAAATVGDRRLLHKEEEGDGFPEWLSAGDRRLLQSKSVKADAVVAKDGSGNYKTISAAVAAAPQKSKTRYVIHIKAGTYKENVEVPKKKTNIMFIGDGRSNTIITGSRNVADGSTTFRSATLAAVGERFLARDIRIENTAGPSKHQAVALRVGSDLSAFYKCDIIAYQDTLYVHSLRQFFTGCLVKGTVDFIFGNAAVVLQNCDLQARRPNKGQKNMFTAQGRNDPNQNTGISIQNCNIRAASDLAPVASSFPTYLGRPWKKYSRTVVMKSSISSIVNPAGWFPWSGNFALSTLFYGEYANSGAGAGTSKRVNWKGHKVITEASEARKFTPGSFIGGSGWLSSTGFPFKLGI